MLTLDSLKQFGANTEEGLARCMGQEAFYIGLINKAFGDDSFERLVEAIEAKDYATAFEIAHALKGITTNLSLTPIADPISEITELLRNETDTDYSALIATIIEKRDELKALL